MNQTCVLISQKNLFNLLFAALITFSGCTSDIQNTDEAVVSQAMVTVDPTVTYQVIEGWGEGGMDTFTPAWYVLFRPAIHETILDSLYTLKDDGLGLNICRFLVPMGDNPEHDHMNYTIPLVISRLNRKTVFLPGTDTRIFYGVPKEPSSVERSCGPVFIRRPIG